MISSSKILKYLSLLIPLIYASIKKHYMHLAAAVPYINPSCHHRISRVQNCSISSGDIFTSCSKGLMIPNTKCIEIFYTFIYCLLHTYIPIHCSYGMHLSLYIQLYKYQHNFTTSGTALLGTAKEAQHSCSLPPKNIAGVWCHSQPQVCLLVHAQHHFNGGVVTGHT